VNLDYLLLSWWNMSAWHSHGSCWSNKMQRLVLSVHAPLKFAIGILSWRFSWINVCFVLAFILPWTANILWKLCKKKDVYGTIELFESYDTQFKCVSDMGRTAWIQINVYQEKAFWPQLLRPFDFPPHQMNRVLMKIKRDQKTDFVDESRSQKLSEPKGLFSFAKSPKPASPCPWSPLAAPPALGPGPGVRARG